MNQIFNKMKLQTTKQYSNYQNLIIKNNFITGSLVIYINIQNLNQICKTHKKHIPKNAKLLYCLINYHLRIWLVEQLLFENLKLCLLCPPILVMYDQLLYELYRSNQILMTRNMDLGLFIPFLSRQNQESYSFCKQNFQ